MKLLTVDDSLVMRRIIKNAASVLDLECAEAKNGKEALEVLEAEGDQISLILLDQNMPEMSGIEVLQAIKADDRFKHIPVMMVTSEAGGQAVVQAIKAGASNYLNKPFAQEDLLAKIMQCLGQG